MGAEWLNSTLFHELISVNRQLWNVEDDVRRCDSCMWHDSLPHSYVQTMRPKFNLGDMVIYMHIYMYLYMYTYICIDVQ